MCVFCKIIAGEIPSKKAYEDDDVLAIYDINPQAPVHIVFMPKAHILTCADDINEGNAEIIGKIFAAIAKVAKDLDCPTAIASSIIAAPPPDRPFSTSIFISLPAKKA